MIRVWTYREGNKVEALLVRVHSGGQVSIMYRDGEFDTKEAYQIRAIDPRWYFRKKKKLDRVTRYLNTLRKKHGLEPIA